VKIITESSAIHNAVLNVMMSNTEIAITLPRIARLHSKLVQSFITSLAICCKCSKIKRQKSRSQDQRSSHSVK